MNKILSCCVALSLSVVASHAVAQTSSPMQADEEQLTGMFEDVVYSPFAGAKYPPHPLWGDSHLHTSLSFDAGGFGNRLPPSVAYRFARGEEVVSSTGQPIRLARPLDWLAITDHSDGMGLSMMCLLHPHWSQNMTRVLAGLLGSERAARMQ